MTFREAVGALRDRIAKLRKRIAERNLPNGLEFRPEPPTTRLNRRAFIVVGIVLVAVLLSAVATLVENDRRLRAAQAVAPRPAPAPEPFWRSQPDGVAMPPRAASGASVVEVPPEPERPLILDEKPPLGLGTASGHGEDEARLRRAYEAAPIVGGFRKSRPESAQPARLVGQNNAPQAALAGDTAVRTLAAAQSLAREPDPTLAQNNQAAKREFLEKASLAREEEVNGHLLVPPLSPYEVTAGAIVPAVLITDANSDLPGMMTARVRENVYDSATGDHLLIPQGTLITGVYDSVVTYGQERLLVAWQRLIFPDGTNLNLGSMPGVDDQGGAGFRDQVERHMLRVFGSATLLSVISGGLQLSQGGIGTQNASRSPDMGETLSAALGQNLGEAASQMIRRNLSVQPSIEIRPGYRFHVFVRKDLVFPGPYSGA